MMGKWTALIAFPLLLVGLVASAGTLAWFTAQATATNKLEGPQYRFDVPLDEVFTPPTTPLEPGDPYPKEVGATNTGDLPGFVRLLVFPTVVAADGVTVLPARLGAEIVLLGQNTTAWMDGEDGYFYYLKRLAPGETTPPLFAAVKLADHFSAAYKGATLSIDVKVEASGTKPWAYRVGWWGSATPSLNGNLITIDNTLGGLTQ
jgi:predicted ribosomally synthesized peptide with SipW-like signal peptide